MIIVTDNGHFIELHLKNQYSLFFQYLIIQVYHTLHHMLNQALLSLGGAHRGPGLTFIQSVAQKIELHQRNTFIFKQMLFLKDLHYIKYLYSKLSNILYSVLLGVKFKLGAYKTDHQVYYVMYEQRKIINHKLTKNVNKKTFSTQYFPLRHSLHYIFYINITFYPVNKAIIQVSLYNIKVKKERCIYNIKP